MGAVTDMSTDPYEGDSICVLVCWWCGAEADDVVQVHQFGRPVRAIPNWPFATDHQHAEDPPSPAQLERAGHAALMRIVEA